MKKSKSLKGCKLKKQSGFVSKYSQIPEFWDFFMFDELLMPLALESDKPFIKIKNYASFQIIKFRFLLQFIVYTER
mgnify:CR=1 FL=1